ncbi:MAG: RidA family protein [Alphaproteobacteria bacterium]|nr:RidA family protein [Alphaproteobacteria bacterium]MCZ6838730.1 RidA family protein [Alphaproteobacteria bacterium]
MTQIEQRLEELGIVLPRPPKAVANYIAGVKVGEILYVAGTIGTVVDENDNDVLTIKGKLGSDLTVEEGYRSARYTGINHLSMIKSVIGDLDNVVRIVRLIGYVHAAPGFQEAPWVTNGESDLLVEVFGEECGKHGRAALYQNELTLDAPYESEMIVQVKP